jgi:hypothetical protein
VLADGDHLPAFIYVLIDPASSFRQVHMSRLARSTGHGVGQQ